MMSKAAKRQVLFLPVYAADGVLEGSGFAVVPLIAE
jgi:hypothetical protein